MGCCLFDSEISNGKNWMLHLQGLPTFSFCCWHEQRSLPIKYGQPSLLREGENSLSRVAMTAVMWNGEAVKLNMLWAHSCNQMGNQDGNIIQQVVKTREIFPTIVEQRESCRKCKSAWVPAVIWIECLTWTIRREDVLFDLFWGRSLMKYSRNHFKLGESKMGLTYGKHRWGFVWKTKEGNGREIDKWEEIKFRSQVD